MCVCLEKKEEKAVGRPEEADFLLKEKEREKKAEKVGLLVMLLLHTT